MSKVLDDDIKFAELNGRAKDIMTMLATTSTTNYYGTSVTDKKYCHDCNKVYPNIYISGETAAKDIDYLKHLGVTHVLNAAEGANFGMVNTNQHYYLGSHIHYMGIRILDLPTTDISIYFERVADFIDSALRKGGVVLVHCLMGISRSSTCVAAYLVIKKRLTVKDALLIMKKQRDIHPNFGFIFQLIKLEDRVFKK